MQGRDLCCLRGSRCCATPCPLKRRLGPLYLTTAVCRCRGHFHLYPDTPSGRNYIRRQIGSCARDSWVMNTTMSTMNVSGPAMLWMYLYRNCTKDVSSAVEIDILLAENGAAATNVTLKGYATTGRCRQLSQMRGLCRS